MRLPTALATRLSTAVLARGAAAPGAGTAYDGDFRLC